MEILETIFLLLFRSKNSFLYTTYFLAFIFFLFFCHKHYYSSVKKNLLPFQNPSLQYTKMFDLDDITNEHNEEHNKKWPYIPDHPYKMLIFEGSGSGKTNALLNLIKEQDSDNLIDNIYLYAKNLSEPKYQFLIKKREDVGIKHLNDPKAFVEYSNTMHDIFNNIYDYNPTRKRRILIAFDDMIADIMTNKKFQAIIKELFIRCSKLNISLAFITQTCFTVPKEVRLNSIHYLITKIRDKREL